VRDVWEENSSVEQTSQELKTKEKKKRDEASKGRTSFSDSFSSGRMILDHKIVKTKSNVSTN
jgi:hypothetical protein